MIASSPKAQLSPSREERSGLLVGAGSQEAISAVPGNHMAEPWDSDPRLGDF